MEIDHNAFYSSYLKEYHIVRAIYLKRLLNSEEEINTELAQFEFGTKLTKNTKFIIQADLRQNYFHAIETFFELFFALLPTANNVPDGRKIIERLSKSDWRKNYTKIGEIAKGKMKLDFLNQMVDFGGHSVSIGHYLFYPGIVLKDKFPQEVFDLIRESVEALKDGIRTIAIDFSDRDEYNAYKHALRIFPTFKSIHFVDQETMTSAASFDLSNSVSYYLFDEKNKKSTVRTNVLDPERNYQMAFFCGNMTYNLIYFRSLVYRNPKEEEKNQNVPIRFFDSKAIEACKTHNVNIQDLTFITSPKKE